MRFTLLEFLRLSPWRLGILLAILLPSLVLILLNVPLVNNDTQGVIKLTQAEFINQDTSAPPSATDPDWHMLDLPDLWTERGLYAEGGWYRLHLHLDALPPELWGIYLQRIILNAGVYLNGQYLGDGGRFSAPMARNWNRPLYFTVPPALWKTGDNEILIRLRTDIGYGMMASPYVGAEALLKQRFESRLFIQSEVSAYMAIALTLVGSLTFGLWLRRRQDTMYLWFAASSLCWVVFSSTLFIRNQPFPDSLFLWGIHTALDFWMVFLVCFVHRYLGVSYPRRERFLLYAQIILASGHLILPLLAGYSMCLAAHTLTLLALFYLVFISWHSTIFRQHTEHILISAGMTVLFVAGFHDFLMERPLPGLQSWETMVWLWRNHFHLLYFAVPTLILVLAWHLTGRFIHALNEAEALNLNLVNRINEAYERMNEDFDKRRILERKQAAAEAREHVFSDLHDDLGAKLLTLAISAANPENADIARTALHDLRDVVSRSSHETTELVYLLASWREEMEGRLLTAGVNLEWQQSDDLPDVRVSHSVAIEIGRILREGISNVLRHAQAMHLQVEVEHDDEHVAISFEDDGKGMKEQTRGGRGMQNMKMRAAKVGGNISWEHGRLGGCWIKMTVPLTRLNSFSNE